MLIIASLSIWLILLSITNQTSAISYNQPKFSPCVSWNTSATTFANKDIVGMMPYAVFVDANDTIYVTNRGDCAVPVWSKGSVRPIRNISGILTSPRSIFVTINGDVYVDNGNGGQVDKWTLNATHSELALKAAESCFGLFVDVSDNLYCSVGEHHRVIKRSLYSAVNATIVVAGNGSWGSGSNLLDQPRGIFVHINLDLYVADSSNNRIQFFQAGQLNGRTVAGNGESGAFILKQPHGIVLDGDSNLFIVDSGNHRILASGPTGFRCLIGCSSKSGSTSDQLSFPQTTAFDSYGNLYVSDRDNNRIQKILLTINSCVQPSFPFFAVSTCIDSSRIGLNCDSPNDPCNMTQPCLNNVTCHNNATKLHGYFCSCPAGVNGTQCQFDHRPCKPNTCWNNGKCNETSNTTFICLCQLGWHDTHCQTKSNYCENVTCLNNGVCRPLFRNYTCECLGDSYSGRHCEITATKMKIYKIVSKSFAYVAIIAMVTVAMFIIIMDVLKYGFGIDPTLEELERIRRDKQAKKHKPPLIQRFVYVSAPMPVPSEDPMSIVKKNNCLEN